MDSHADRIYVPSTRERIRCIKGERSHLRRPRRNPIRKDFHTKIENGSGRIRCVSKPKRDGQKTAPLLSIEILVRTEQPGRSRRTSFRGGILGMVTRLIKWSASERNLPADSFSIHSLRSGGATCLYHSGVDLEYIRRFGRWKSSAFSIYLHFGDKLLRKLSTCLMESECLMTQLKVCTDQGNKLEYDHKGEQVRVTTQDRASQRMTDSRLPGSQKQGALVGTTTLCHVCSSRKPVEISVDG